MSMGIRKKVLSLLSGLFLFYSGIALSQIPAAVEFSADTIQIVPKQENRKGRIFVGKKRVRTELEMNGRVIVTIIDPVEQISWVLYPQQRSYIEHANRSSHGSADKLTKTDSPCQGQVGAICKRLGEEKIHGRVAVKWDVSYKTEKGTSHSLQWIDKSRSILLRHVIDNGPRMDQSLLGMDTLNSRVVEKWEQVVVKANSLPQSSIRWFDPELNLAIKEKHPGGYVREMHNIRIEQQPESLFTVPGNYQKIRSK